MKAILDNDIILRFDEANGIEIGALLKQVPHDRLRFDGDEVVDLYLQSEFYVEFRDGVFLLHVVDVIDSQLVQMNYRDRKFLTNDAGIYRVLTNQEIVDNEKNRRRSESKNRLRQSIKTDVGDAGDNTSDAFKLLILLAFYVRTQNAQAEQLLDQFLIKAKDIYPIDRIKDGLINLSQKMKTKMDNYYQELDDIETSPETPSSGGDDFIGTSNIPNTKEKT